MEQNHYNDEFEKMLRDSTENFRMYPSRKVWHSIYNDLHPDRKWPSLAVCLVLLTAILHIGVSNNNIISKNSSHLFPSAIINSEIKDSQEKSVTTGTSSKLSKSDLAGSMLSESNQYPLKDNFTTNVSKETVDPPLVLIGQSISVPKNLDDAIMPERLIEPNNNSAIENGKLVYMPVFRGIHHLDLANEKQPPLLETDKQYGNNKLTENSKPEQTKTQEIISSIKDLPGNIENVAKNSLVKNEFPLSSQDRAWIDNYSFYNKKNKEKWKAKFSVQYYITPSVGYRDLYKNNDYEPSTGLLIRATNNDDVVTQLAAANLEGGATLLLKMNKRLRLKTGLQLNLTNYVTYAHKLEHPTQTTVLLNSSYNDFVVPAAYSTNYGNIPGSNLDHLNNKTAQISMPIGADFKILGKEKLKWYVGATIQPTRILGGDAYLISSDVKNFASDASMIRKWNFNSSVETFISYKMPSGLNINLGPQFRYQLMSTYSKQYTYSEKLYNIGLKIGLSSNF